MFLLAFVFSGTLSWFAFALFGELSGTVDTSAYYPSWHVLFGGLLFGLGAAFNSGCGVSTISRLARGHFVMLAIICGWLTAWVAFSALDINTTREALEVSSRTQYTVLVLISVFLLLIIYKLNAENRKLWLSMLGIGLMAGAVFIYEPHWTPSGLLKGISLSIWNGTDDSWPKFERFLLIFFLIFGMLLAAIIIRSFKAETGNLKQYVQHLFAGILMGLGAVLAGGGNDTQLLVALPALSPSGALAVIAIVLGIYIGGLVRR
ncbi:YeeE/YedE thiosulfate transporter family protein [Vibrio sp. SCSIO 43137]|nr:YeeE/YedE thiosulfate transporter family protein [Vibrio sp. SCSIO 43137]WCE31233.1 YeeE/YedE thiosulfate transporter family protein [Vibrio sp. SCSIO 43137]